MSVTSPTTAKLTHMNINNVTINDHIEFDERLRRTNNLVKVRYGVFDTTTGSFSTGTVNMSRLDELTHWGGRNRQAVRWTTFLTNLRNAVKRRMPHLRDDEAVTFIGLEK